MSTVLTQFQTTADLVLFMDIMEAHYNEHMRGKVEWEAYREFVVFYDHVKKSLGEMRDGHLSRKFLRLFHRDYFRDADQNRLTRSFNIYCEVVASYDHIKEKFILAHDGWDATFKKRPLEEIIGEETRPLAKETRPLEKTVIDLTKDSDEEGGEDAVVVKDADVCSDKKPL